MKKTSLILLFLAFATTTFAQVEIGIKLSPSVAYNRITASDNAPYTLENSGSNLRFGIGLVADYFFGENYAFGTGLMFNTKGGKVEYTYITADTIPKTVEESLNIHYLELPITLKLYTNDIATDTKLYFQLGGALNTRISAQVDNKKTIDNTRVTKRFNLFEVETLIGAGAEMQMGQNTKVFGGLSYHRGLTDVDKHYEKLLNDESIAVKNGSIALDLGLKF
ncbi:MAG: PorT family protein [Hymenobacteraceae bacterium]|nr:PorT family protein [Hymenobacteraceae bacterium]MDX5394709.1 PorT family protein [Hymenobacteraceae bacterium]MDX5510742.1 PorT family protein [Hymenobacteraceae bacterium]